MTVLVTGASGFTGGHLARALARDGITVRALVRATSRLDGLRDTGIEPVVGDLTDAASVARAARGTTVIYHVGALYREASVPAARYQAVNVGGTQHVLRAALDAGARVVHCSTVGVHGDVEHPPATEGAPFRPGDAYQRSKVEAERAAVAWSEEHGLPVVIARPTGIYGPGDTRLLKLFRLIARRRFFTLGRGEIFYHLTHVSDVVAGLRRLADAGTPGRAYILGGPEVTTLNELVSRIAHVVGAPVPRLHLPVWPVWLAGALCEAVCVPLRIEPPLYRRRVDFFTKSRAFDIGRARSELGLEPKVTLDQGLRQTAEWYRKEGWL